MPVAQWPWVELGRLTALHSDEPHGFGSVSPSHPLGSQQLTGGRSAGKARWGRGTFGVCSLAGKPIAIQLENANAVTYLPREC